MSLCSYILPIILSNMVYINYKKQYIVVKFVVSICYNGYIILFQNQNT